MAKILEEAVKGQTFKDGIDGASATVVYYVSGATSPWDAINTVGIPALGDEYTDPDYPLTVFYATVSDITANNIEDLDDIHEVVVNYNYTRGKDTERPNNPVDGDEVYTFEPTGETVTVKVCNNLGQETFQDATGTPVEKFNNSIGVNADGSIDGVSILDSSEVLTVTKWKSLANYTTTFINNVRAEYAKVNSVTWYGAAPGECLFKGMRKVSENSQVVELEYTFVVSKNVDQADIADFENLAGDTIQVTGGKEGWQYLWVQSGENIKAKKTYTKFVSVANVYEKSDFTNLELTGLQ